MKLKRLLKDIPHLQIKGPKDVDVTGICANSKLAAPGSLFLARKGKNDDGSKYIREAIFAGAVAVVTDIYDPSLKEITQIIHPNPGDIEGLLSALYYQFPSRDLFMVGITGTNGKTTTSILIKYLLDQLRGPCGLIGTIEYIIGQHRYQATRTTPDVTANHKMLRDMVAQGCRSAVMEVTSHALDQNRVQYIDFDVAVFTNLTLDHLDYHHTMEDYCRAKNRLFCSLKNDKQHKSSKAVINADSPWVAKMTEGCRVPLITYGINSAADVRASEIDLSPLGTKATVTYQGRSLECQWPLIGRFNVYNCLAAIAVCLSLNVSFEEIASKLSHLSSPQGRLQLVPNDLNLKIYVDFAHTDDALTNVLESLSELKTGKIITVFGCGGDRDKTKRPKMAQAAELYSDISIVTSDNPRSEDPSEICRQIIQGFRRQDSYVVELDRREAIKKAIDLAGPQDIILIAGKGHEAYQVFSHQTVEFNDWKVALEVCRQKQVVLGNIHV